MQNVTFLIATLGIVVAAIIAFTNGRSDFVSRFNEYVAAAGGVANALDIAQAQSGYAARGFDWYQTFLSLSLPLYIVLYAITSSIIGGEVKNARKAQIFGMPGSVVYTTLWMVLLIGGFQLLAGYDLLGHLGAVDPGALGLDFTPTFIELAGAMVYENLFLVLLLGVGFLLWTYVWLPINFLASTRILLAWSFDRLIPTKFSEITTRYRAPLWAIVAVILAAEVFLWLGIYSPAYSSAILYSIVAWFVAWVILGIAGIVYPYRRKALFEAGPPATQRRIAGIPVISILGFLTLAVSIFTEWAVAQPFFKGDAEPNQYITVLGMLVIPLIIYVIAHFYHQSRGIPLKVQFSQVPPE